MSVSKDKAGDHDNDRGAVMVASFFQQNDKQIYHFAPIKTPSELPVVNHLICWISSSRTPTRSVDCLEYSDHMKEIYTLPETSTRTSTSYLKLATHISSALSRCSCC
jgi:hypothetical protein